jgi:hypothetical protein
VETVFSIFYKDIKYTGSGATMQAVARAKDKIKKFRRKTHSGQGFLTDFFAFRQRDTTDTDFAGYPANLKLDTGYPVHPYFRPGTLNLC